MKDFIEKLISGQDLSEDEMEKAFDMIMSGRPTISRSERFLIALRAKGERPSEIASAARIMRDKALQASRGFRRRGYLRNRRGRRIDLQYLHGRGLCPCRRRAQGGKARKPIGQLLVRQCRLPRGARACPSISTPDEAAKALKEGALPSCSRPRYHPSMKYAMPARKQLGMKTIFNILGPLTNPAGAAYQVIGVFRRILSTPSSRC